MDLPYKVLVRTIKAHFRTKLFLMTTEKEDLSPEASILLDLARSTMPFGKFAGRRLVDLPEEYVLWFEKKGYPDGDIGDKLRQVYEINLAGLGPMVRKIR